MNHEFTIKKRYMTLIMVGPYYMGRMFGTYIARDPEINLFMEL